LKLNVRDMPLSTAAMDRLDTARQLLDDGFVHHSHYQQPAPLIGKARHMGHDVAGETPGDDYPRPQFHALPKPQRADALAYPSLADPKSLHHTRGYLE
jgi:hypothetical protein